MKKLAIALLFMSAITACNQVTDGKEAPENIKTAFAKSHPNATILKWNDEPPIWEAKYKDGNEKGAVSFDTNGMVTETELVIDENQLPNGTMIPDYIKTKYPKEKIQNCEKVTKAGGTITYEIQITGKELVFDKDGKYLEDEPD